MITSIPAVDKQGNQVNVGDRIMYITNRHSEIVLHYAWVMGYCERIIPGRLKCYTMLVKKFATGKEVFLRNPQFFKCGVELTYPTNTKLKGMI